MWPPWIALGAPSHLACVPNTLNRSTTQLQHPSCIVDPPTSHRSCHVAGAPSAACWVLHPSSMILTAILVHIHICTAHLDHHSNAPPSILLSSPRLPARNTHFAILYHTPTMPPISTASPAHLAGPPPDPLSTFFSIPRSMGPPT